MIQSLPVAGETFVGLVLQPETDLLFYGWNPVIDLAKDSSPFAAEARATFGNVGTVLHCFVLAQPKQLTRHDGVTVVQLDSRFLLIGPDALYDPAGQAYTIARFFTVTNAMAAGDWSAAQ